MLARIQRIRAKRAQEGSQIQIQIQIVQEAARFAAEEANQGTLLKRRHLHLLGHALVSVPYWEWVACKGPVEREQYLRLKLGTCGPSVEQGDM
jgi:hypothetical protein